MFSTKSLFLYLPLRNSPVCDVNELTVHVIFRKETEAHQAPRPGISKLFFRCTDISLVHQILILIYGKHPREGRRGGGWSTTWSVLVSTLGCRLGTCPEAHTHPFVGMSGSPVGTQRTPDSQIQSHSAGIETWACAERSQPVQSAASLGSRLLALEQGDVHSGSCVVFFNLLPSHLLQPGWAWGRVVNMRLAHIREFIAMAGPSASPFSLLIWTKSCWECAYFF